MMARENSYPPNFINNLISNFISKLNLSHSHLPDTTISTPMYFSIPYVPGVTEKINALLKKYNVRLAPKCQNNLRHLYNNKDPITVKNRHNVVYVLKCRDCPPPGAVYVGQTGRKLSIRMYEHDYSVRKSKRSTALSIHCIDNDHTFDFDNVEILSFEPNYNKRTTSEKCYIKLFGNRSINFHTDCEGLSGIYDGIISDLASRCAEDV